MKTGSNLERVLISGQFAATGELGPPKSADPDVIREKASLLKGYVDAVNITDNQTAIVRMSSISVGTMLLSLGLEPTIQMTCRDRNRLAIQADLLGAAALGMKNLLCLTGDHQSFGNHPTARGVYDLDSVQLVRMVRDMRDGKRFACGEEIKVEPRFLIGAATNPFADPFEYRPLRLAQKIAAGADFVQTQLIYNVPKFMEFMKKVVDLGLHEKCRILAGVGPIKSVGMARYMQNNVPGMDVPDDIIDHLRQAPKDQRRTEGIKQCADIISELREVEGVAGVHVMAIEWEEAVPQILELAGLLPRPQVR
jgi:methylenetetrahydrofolate reductase (NADPH)